MPVLHQLKNHLGEVYVTISHEPTLDAVSDVWTGPFGAKEAFRKALLLVVEELEKHHQSAWLADLRGMKGSWQSSQEWVANEIVPRSIKAGLQREAVVLPKDIFAKLSTTETTLLIDQFELRQFDDVEAARAWLFDKKRSRTAGHP